MDWQDIGGTKWAYSVAHTYIHRDTYRDREGTGARHTSSHTSMRPTAYTYTHRYGNTDMYKYGTQSYINPYRHTAKIYTGLHTYKHTHHTWKQIGMPTPIHTYMQTYHPRQHITYTHKYIHAQTYIQPHIEKHNTPEHAYGCRQQFRRTHQHPYIRHSNIQAWRHATITHIQTNNHTCRHNDIHMHTHICTQIHNNTHTNTHTTVQARIHAYTHICIHTW